MRSINEPIEAKEEYQTFKIATKENITHYTNHLKIKAIEVSVELLTHDDEVVKTEHYTFLGENYLPEFDTDDLWELIDKKRKEIE